MKRSLVILVVVAQVAVVAFMAAQREWIARTGTLLTLRTAPIDPHDPMRGEFVRFQFEINRVPAALFRDGLVEWKEEKNWRASQRYRDRVVFARLQQNPSGFAELVSLSDERPASGLFLRGRVQAVHAGVDGVEAVDVRYGVEAMFVQQGEGRKIEDLARGEKSGVPSNIAVAVGASGTAVLRDFWWEPLGLTIQPERSPASDQPRNTAANVGLRTLTVTLKNHGDQPLAIVDLPGGRAFRLRADSLARDGYHWVNQDAGPDFSPAAAHVIVLQPGEAHTVRLDLVDAYWWVKANDGDPAQAMPLHEVQNNWMASFRLEYAPPTPEQVRGWPNAELIRHVPVTSRRFTGGGLFD